MARTIIRSLRAYDALPAAAVVRVPTLVVNREQEWVPADVARDLAERVPGARLALLPGDEHACYFAGARSRALLTLLFTDIVGSTAAAADGTHSSSSTTRTATAGRSRSALRSE